MVTPVAGAGGTAPGRRYCGVMVAPGITVDPAICEGRPHLSGTTTEPATLYARWKAGESSWQIARSIPELDESAVAVQIGLAYAAGRADERRDRKERKRRRRAAHYERGRTASIGEEDDRG